MEPKNLNFFGSYLLEKGVISQQDLQDAIAFQEESNRRIGELARERGYLTKEQTEAIFLEQKSVDQPFGTIALKHKYLTRSQLDDLLFAQTVFSTHLGEALLIKGYLSPEQFSQELEAFRQQQLQRQAQLDAFFKDLPEKSVFQAIVASVNRAYVRFGGRELKLDSVCEKPDTLHEIRFSITVKTQDTGTVVAEFYLDQELAEELLRVFSRSGAAGKEKGPSGLKAFFEIVLRYLQMTLAEQGVAVEQGEVAGGVLDPAAPVPEQSGVVMQLVTPAGPVTLRAMMLGIEKGGDCDES